MHKLTMNRLMLWCLIGIGVWFCHANVLGQNTPAPPGIADGRREIIIRQAPLDAYILDNPDIGRAIRLTGGWPLVVLDNFYDSLMRIQQNQVPPFTIRNVSATGTVAENYVKTSVQIEFTVSGSQIVQIPLGLKEGILLDEDPHDLPSFSYTGPGAASLTVDAQERHYIVIVTPYVPQASESEGLRQPEIAESASHAVSLQLWFPVAGNGNEEKRLSLSFPNANSSQFLLEVPMTNLDTLVTRGFLFDKQENIEQQSTLLRIHGLHTNTEITWRKREPFIVDDHPVLLIEGAEIDVRLTAQSTIYDAVLPVNSETGSFDQLQIRLPHDSTLDRESTDRYAAASNYVIEEVSSDSVVTIRFPQKTTGPISIHLRAVQQFEGDAFDFRRKLTGFEVLGAERQAGFLTVSVFPSEMKPHWEPGRGIRRTEGGGSSTSTPGDTRFEIVSQPFHLNVRVTAPQMRINVRPDYQFHISRGAITMNARLTYTVSGSGAEVLYLRLPDSQWYQPEFVTSSIVDTTRVELDGSGLLTIPLRSNPPEGPFDVEFRVYRTIDAEDEQRHRLVLPFPRPEHETVARSEPATVTIVPVYNVEILPIDQETRGLTRLSRRTMPTPIRIDTSDTQQEHHLFYRAEQPEAAFVADLVFQSQKINATMQTDVRLFEEDSQVRQTISYNTSFAMAERVFVLLPRALDTSGAVQVQLNNRTWLELRDPISTSQENIPDDLVRKMIQLPEPVFQFQLTFQYQPPSLVVADDDTVPFSLPLICPADVPVTGHRIHFFIPSGYRVTLQPESRRLWEPFREPRRPILNVTETFRSAQSPTKIALFVAAAERNVSGTTIVERAWLQTWLTGDIRVDRATYLLRSTNDVVALQLPPDSLREHRVTVQVEGQQIIQPNISPAGVLSIPILPEQYNRPIEVSVEYRYTFEISDIEVPIILPSFPGDTLVQYQFWQVILQQNQHIIGAPVGWTLEYNWSWNGLFWWRVPSVRKSDIGFLPDKTDTEVDISAASQYVFSHIQPPRNVTLYVVNRSRIILVSSSIALLIGLVLIYIPQSRYVGSLFGLGIVLLAVLLYQPPLVLLMLQAATLGIFLALGTGYVYRIFHRQKQWVSPAFQMMDEMSQPYLTPAPVSQTVHEVIIEGESDSKEPSAVHNHNGLPPNGQ